MDGRGRDGRRWQRLRSGPCQARLAERNSGRPGKALSVCRRSYPAENRRQPRSARPFIPDSRSRGMAIAKANGGIDRLSRETFSDLNAIFAVEGECASAYFKSWEGLPVRWTELARRPVPVSWHCYSGRSSLAVGIKPENRNASHPINAMLNYAYAVKLSQLQIDAIANGYDPILGIMHNSKKGQPGSRPGFHRA